MPEILKVRKLADTSDGERVRRFDPETGEAYLADPAEPGTPKPWPLAGVEVVGEPPRETTMSTTFVDRAVAEGWIELVNPRTEHRPGGPVHKPWAVTHSFTHADAIVLKCVGGDVRYRVTQQPDKYHDGPPGTDAVGDPTAEVRWFYVLELEG